MRRPVFLIPLLIGDLSTTTLIDAKGKEKKAKKTIADYLVRTTSSPALTDWGPRGERLASSQEYDDSSSSLLPDPDHFYTFHGSVRSTDEVNIVFAPVFEKTWEAESTAVLTESPVFGADGSSYFIPGQATDGGQNMLVKVSPEGEREFAITRNQLGDVTLPGTDTTLDAFYGMGSTPVILKNPDSQTGGETVFAATYVRAYAADENGDLLWNTQVLPPAIKAAMESDDPDAALQEELDKPHRIYGINYHPAVDAYIIADISGDVMAFDRESGAQIGGITMPGSPAKGGDNDLQDGLNEDVLEKLIDLLVKTANELFENDGIEYRLTPELVDRYRAVLGSGAVIGNQISIDPHSHALWVASTDVDEADGSVDGRSELGALYRIDLERPVAGDALAFEIHCHAPFDGGTTSTPAVSADGERVYTTDNFGSAIAIDRECNRTWELDVGESAVASLAVSSEVGAEIYYPTLSTVYKIQENSNRNGATIEWQADLDASFADKKDKKYGDFAMATDTILEAVLAQIEKRIGSELPKDSVSIGASNLDLATIGQNGVMIHSGYGLQISLGDFSTVLPLALNNALYDRDTGDWINGNQVAAENIGAMYTAPDGTIIMGGPGPRRAILRGLLKAPDLYLPEFPGVVEDIKDDFADFLVPPLQGGIAKYGVTERFDLIARDAVCQASKRITNTQVYSSSRFEVEPLTIGYMADVIDTKRLIDQASQAVVDARIQSELGEETAFQVQQDVDDAVDSLNANDLISAAASLTRACSELTL